MDESEVVSIVWAAHARSPQHAPAAIPVSLQRVSCRRPPNWLLVSFRTLTKPYMVGHHQHFSMTACGKGGHLQQREMHSTSCNGTHGSVCMGTQVQDEGDVDQLLDVEYEDDAVEDAFENEFGDMPGAAQVTTD